MAKRIIIVGTAHPYRGGLAAFNERLAHALIEAGHYVEIVTFTLQYPNFLFPGESQTDDRPAPPDLPISGRINSIWPISWLNAARYIARQEPDLLICKFWLPFMAPALGSVLRLSKRLARIRSRKAPHVLSIVDNIIPHEPRLGDRAFAQYFSNSVDDFIVMSRSVETEMQVFAKARQKVIYHPHPIYDNFGPPLSRDESIRHLQLEPGCTYLLFFGFIRDYKGLDLLLEAFALLPETEFPTLRLIVAGEFYGNRERYEALIQSLGIARRLVLHNHFIANDEVRYYFGAADLLVQPYKSATQSGISQMAYHFGLPMVVTRVGGLPEIVPHEEAGYVVDTNPADIAEAIRRFVQLDPEAQEALRQNVRALARQYEWPALVEVIEDLL